jgi:DNA-directed RNA polymerase subunit E'
MYKILTVSDKIRVPPSNFDMDIENAVKQSLEKRWEGLIEKDIGIILSVVDIKDMGEGRILPGDGAIYYPVQFRILAYSPELHEVVKGFVIDVTEFGAFARIGPLDGMVHVSQIMNDFVSYDQKNATFNGRESKRVLKEKDSIRARIISVSLAARQYKIGLTTRQFGLGADGWVDAEKKRLRERPKASGRAAGRTHAKGSKAKAATRKDKRISSS